MDKLVPLSNDTSNNVSTCNKTGYVIRYLEPLGTPIFTSLQIYKSIEDAKDVLMYMHRIIKLSNPTNMLSVTNHDDKTWIIYYAKINDNINAVINIIYICPVDDKNETIDSILRDKYVIEKFGNFINIKIKEE